MVKVGHLRPAVMAMALRLEGSQADMRHLDLWGHGRPVPARRDAPHGAAGPGGPRRFFKIATRGVTGIRPMDFKSARIFFPRFVIVGAAVGGGSDLPPPS